MSHMLKAALVAAVLGVAVAILTGCGSTPDDPEDKFYDVITLQGKAYGYEIDRYNIAGVKQLADAACAEIESGVPVERVADVAAASMQEDQEFARDVVRAANRYLCPTS
jgi:hypothetical protein